MTNPLDSYPLIFSLIYYYHTLPRNSVPIIGRGFAIFIGINRKIQG
nr:MAG TPA: hypothetical protein [Caudoviricetes sp.]